MTRKDVFSVAQVLTVTVRAALSKNINTEAGQTDVFTAAPSLPVHALAALTESMKNSLGRIVIGY